MEKKPNKSRAKKPPVKKAVEKAPIPSDSLAEEIKMNPEAISELIRVRGIFSSSVSDLKGTVFTLKSRLRSRDPRNTGINDANIWDTDIDGSVRSQIAFSFENGKTLQRVSLKVGQLLNLPCTIGGTIGDLMLREQQTQLPMQIKFVDVEPQIVEGTDDGKGEPKYKYPYHLYKMFADKQVELKSLIRDMNLTNPDKLTHVEFDYSELYQDQSFLAEVRADGVLIATADKEADVMKDVKVLPIF